MKRKIPVLILICFLLPHGLGGCGKKGLPVALDSTVPMPVSDFQAWPKEKGIYLRWTIPTKNIDETKLIDLLGFKVWRQVRSLTAIPCESCPLSFEAIAEIDVDYPRGARLERGMVLWQDIGVRPQNEYIYFIQAYNSYRSPSAESNRVKVFWDDPPAAPTQIHLGQEDRALEITWEPILRLVNDQEMQDLKGFNIYRRSEGEPFSLSPLNSDPLPGKKYWDGQVELGKKYYYEIRTVRNFRGTLIEGPSSAVVQGVPVKRIPPSIPTGLVAVWQKDGVALRWDENPEPDIAGYHLYRKGKEEKEFLKINTGLVGENYFLDRSADPQQSYAYRLQAVDSSPSKNESDFSREIDVAPETPRPGVGK